MTFWGGFTCVYGAAMVGLLVYGLGYQFVGFVRRELATRRLGKARDEHEQWLGVGSDSFHRGPDK